jgi:putative transposase
MKMARFTTEQIIAILQEHATGTEPAELIRRHGISKATLCHWKKQYGDLQVSDARRLKALEDENSRLKRLVADPAVNLPLCLPFSGQPIVPPKVRSGRRKGLREPRQGPKVARCGLNSVSIR